MYAEGAPRLDPELLELGIPVLGICYGMQAIVLQLGGKVEGAEVGEFGRSRLTVREPGRLLAGTPDEQACWMSHRDTVYEPPPGFTALARSTESPVAAIEDVERGIYGIQYHPEVVHTPYGQQVLTTFLRGHLRLRPLVEPGLDHRRADRARSAPRSATAKVICGLSGGVDSSVAALLVHRAIGDQLTCVFVDHGLMRHNEGEQVISAFRDVFKVPLVAVDAEDRFLARLSGLSRARGQAQGDRRRVHPRLRGGGGQARRREVPRPGHAVLRRHRVRRRHRARRRSSPTTTWAACPTTSSSSWWSRCARCSRTRSAPSAPSSACPSASSGASRSPGPGLAIRIVGGEATKERLDTLRACDAILQDEIRKAGLYRELWQSFCVLPDIRTVGVQGDERTYGYVVAIRAVTSDDAMTADWARLPYDLLEQIASRMINEVREVNRVVLDITCKPPGTIEWE